jgi:hypothetical protein
VADFDEYELWFDAYSPETIPLGRLASYIGALAKLLGHEASVHFGRINSGSTAPVAMVEREASPKVAARVEHLGSGGGSAEVLAAFNEINALLRSDNAVGQLRRTPWGGEKRVLLMFPGRDGPEPRKFGPFTEPASVDGELVRIGGRDKTAHAQLLDAEGKFWTFELGKELASRMAVYLYKGPVLRVSGDAKWERSEEGAWVLCGFKVHDFEVLADESLLESVQKLRSLRDTAWAGEVDIDAAIGAKRGQDEGLH